MNAVVAPRTTVENDSVRTRVIKILADTRVPISSAAMRERYFPKTSIGTLYSIFCELARSKVIKAAGRDEENPKRPTYTITKRALNQVEQGIIPKSTKPKAKPVTKKGKRMVNRAAPESEISGLRRGLHSIVTVIDDKLEKHERAQELIAELHALFA